MNEDEISGFFDDHGEKMNLKLISKPVFLAKSHPGIISHKNHLACECYYFLRCITLSGADY
ncbi:MAG: hypothetical protein GY777_12990 [Candidatus Brocadiaceae bacterium]|nr:hypothetical protein [Candidatus Brocadiaceae bacterium]